MSQIRLGFGPLGSSVYRKDIEPLAKKIWNDTRYEAQAPKEIALLYRMYATTILFTRPDQGGPIEIAKDALPWLEKVIELDKSIGDYSELISAVLFVKKVANGKHSAPLALRVGQQPQPKNAAALADC